MRIRAILSAFALVAVSATVAQAQQNPMEIGMDAQIGFGLGDTDGTVIQIPLQKVRVGFPIAPAMSLEPALAFVRGSSNGSSASGLDLDVSLLYHFATDRTANQFYVRPFLGVQRVAGDSDLGGDSSTSFVFGGAGGLKIPVMDRLAARLEAEFRKVNESDLIGESTVLGLNFGFSFFTR